MLSGFRGVLIGAVALAGLSACDAVGQLSGPDPADTADELAAALTSGSFEALTFVDGDPASVAEQYAAIIEGLGELTPTVSATDVETDGRTSALLTWSWPVGDREWTYETTAELTEAGDAWQVDWAPSIVEPSLTDGATLDASPIAAARGRILGAARSTIVTERPVLRFGIDRTLVPARKAAASARRLAALVDIDAAPYAARVGAAGPKAFVEAIVYRDGEVPSSLAGVGKIPGARGIRDQLPLAPTREFAAPLLGTVGQVTAEMIKKDPDRYQLGDEAGLSGLQARYDEQLQGTSGLVVDAIDPDGNLRELFRSPPRRGKALRLTLDVDLQAEAERRLADVAPASALVAIRPSTGAIVAAANGPGNNGYNMATFGQFAPGSTFKSVSSLALLRAGLTPGSTLDCAGADHRQRQGLHQLLRLPERSPGLDPPELGGGQLLQHGVHRGAGPHQGRRPRRGCRLAGPRGRPRPRVPGVLRSGADSGVRDGGGRRPDRSGPDPGLADGDGGGDRLGAGR